MVRRIRESEKTEIALDYLIERIARQNREIDDLHVDISYIIGDLEEIIEAVQAQNEEYKPSLSYRTKNHRKNKED